MLLPGDACWPAWRRRLAEAAHLPEGAGRCHAGLCAVNGEATRSSGSAGRAADGGGFPGAGTDVAGLLNCALVRLDWALELSPVCLLRYLASERQSLRSIS